MSLCNVIYIAIATGSPGYGWLAPTVDTGLDASDPRLFSPSSFMHLTIKEHPRDTTYILYDLPFS
jgi:hypothetical protein